MRTQIGTILAYAFAFASMNASASIDRVAAPLVVQSGKTVSADMTLAKDADWRGEGAVEIAEHATVNLNGHRLYVDALAGGGTVFSSGSMSTFGMNGFSLLEYVETPADNNTEKCRIDTDCVPAATDRVEAGFRLSGTDLQWLFGSYTNGKRFDCNVNNGSLFFHLGDKNGSMGAVANYHNIILDGRLSSALVRKEYVKPQTVSVAQSSFTPDGSIKLFGPADGSTDRYAKSCRLYFFRICDSDGRMRANMLPVRDASGTVGLYDTVRNRFFTPESGALSAGPDNAYEELAYVESPDGNAGTFIDTRYWASPYDRVETRIRLGTLSGNMGIFSARGAYDNRTFNCMLRGDNGISFEHYLSGSGYAYHTLGGVRTAYAPGTDYDLSMDGATRGFTVNGVASETLLGGDLDEVKTNFVLFATADRDSGNIGNFASRLRLYGFKVCDAEGYTTADLVPARRTGDGVCGFYDRARNCFLAPPAGAAAVASGAAVEQTVDLTAPGGRCWASLSAVGDTSVANLFSDNFMYATTPANRFYVGEAELPLSIDYDLGEGNAKAVNMYRIWGGGLGRSPVRWSFWGSNDPSAYASSSEGAWILLDLHAGEPDWNAGECRTKVFANETAYRFYRIKAEEKGSVSYFDLTQLEYFHVGATPRPGELHVDVPSGMVTTNESVRLGGDMKLVLSGGGAFFQNASVPFYTGGTVLRDGEFVVGVPLSTALAMSDDATLGFRFADHDAAPLLMLEGGTSIPSILGVTLYRDGAFTLPRDGAPIATGYDFSGVTVDFAPTDWARRVRAGADGELVVFGPSGLAIILR